MSSESDGVGSAPQTGMVIGLSAVCAVVCIAMVVASCVFGPQLYCRLQPDRGACKSTQAPSVNLSFLTDLDKHAQEMAKVKGGATTTPSSTSSST